MLSPWPDGMDEESALTTSCIERFRPVIEQLLAEGHPHDRIGFALMQSLVRTAETDPIPARAVAILDVASVVTKGAAKPSRQQLSDDLAARIQAGWQSMTPEEQAAHLARAQSKGGARRARRAQPKTAPDKTA